MAVTVTGERTQNAQLLITDATGSGAQVYGRPHGSSSFLPAEGRRSNVPQASTTEALPSAVGRSCDVADLALESCDFTGTFVSARSSYDKAGLLGELDFENLVEFYYGPLYRFAMSLTRTESDAGDLVQDTFLAWAAKGHQLRDRTKVKAWLFTTLHRRFLESQRRATRFPHLEMDAVAEDLPSLEPGLVDQLDGQTVVQMLAKVDAQFQAAVALFYLEDYSYNEIAAILEVPLGTVKSRIARGLAQLRALVQENSSAQTRTGEEPA
jgi:RNA polymerase sigma-70 factor (ECF subfamily)